MEITKSYFTKRVNALNNEGAYAVLDKANEFERRSGKEVIRLQIGEPDFDTPNNIRKAGIESIKSGFTHYTPISGIDELKDAIIKYTKDFKGFDCERDQIIITPGAKHALFCSIMSLIEKNDEVLYPNPTYPIYKSIVNFSGGTPVAYPVLEENDFEIDVEDLKSRITDKTKMIILNSPANPTGGVLSKKVILEIAQAVKDKGIYVLTDDIYSRIAYDEKPVSIATIPEMKDYTITIDGFSKSYAMTGWRLGYAIVNKELYKKMELMMANTVSNTSGFIQIAGVEALNGSQNSVNMMVEKFKERRDFIVERLNLIDGVTCKIPKGAFYAFPNVSSFGYTSQQLADYILYRANVALLPGSGFGEYGEGYLRISYANSIENISKAMDNIERALKNLKVNHDIEKLF
ncbi:MAG: pyridoxal phosphate-dependent aminotransferase [Peptoniphilaceae bacterium]|nr:pyridoxal phosphate-dependent aminotransferase [Peptoniphilaceae bacterium]MDD7382984.1 pyridoxal phosphate-dependent aminotransferase [Peptoniphilaceae bacterium]MDY3737735.1 pyridoxal phosphate-dependent aminotransferase [Peptoniphilaceae bacterium]